MFTPGANGAVDFGGDDVIIPGGISSFGNTYTFTGRELDSETGLFYYRARYYDSTKGRFVQRDPIGGWADGINVGNAYTYVGNRPPRSVDPLGLLQFMVNVKLGWQPPAKAKNPAVQEAFEKLLKALGAPAVEILSVQFKMDFKCQNPPACDIDHETPIQPKPVWSEAGEQGGGKAKTPLGDIAFAVKRAYSEPTIYFKVHEFPPRCREVELAVSMTSVVQGEIDFTFEGKSISIGGKDPPKELTAKGRFRVCCCCVDEKDKQGKAIGTNCDYDAAPLKWSQTQLTGEFYWKNTATLGTCAGEKKDTKLGSR
jgi:RHS repeat-associated protein